MQFPGFCGPAYQSRSLTANAQRCVNWYVELDPSGNRGPSILYPTPGLSVLTTVGSGPIRGVYAAGGSWLIVSGGELYRLTTGYVATLLVALSTSTGPVSFCQAGTQAMMVDGSKGYGVDLSAWTAALIADTDFPANPATCTALDGYFITHAAGGEQFNISDPFDCFTWNALDFASAESRNDALVAVNADGRELFLVGNDTVEVWANVGSSDFPFERVQGALVEHGTPAPYSLARLPTSLFMLASDPHGDRYAAQCVGYQSTRITTTAIETEWRSYSTVSDARAWTYQQDGHSFYVVNFPAASKTWVYDASTQAWHERAYYNAGVLEASRAFSHAYLNGVHLVGDRANSNIYAMSPDVYTDNGAAIRRIRTSPHLFAEGSMLFSGIFEAFFQPGVGVASGQGSSPVAMLRISRDGGQTYGIERTASIGAIGNTRARSRWNRCGSGRDLVFELSVSDPVKAVVVDAAIATVKGNS